MSQNGIGLNWQFSCLHDSAFVAVTANKKERPDADASSQEGAVETAAIEFVSHLAIKCDL